MLPSCRKYTNHELVVQDVKLIDFSADPGSGTPGAQDSDYMATLAVIQNYFQKAKFVFYRDKGLYDQYLTQLKYFVCHVAPASQRHDLLAGLVREQAMREGQYAIKDSDLVQMILEIIYSPTYKPLVLSAEETSGDA